MAETTTAKKPRAVKKLYIIAEEYGDSNHYEAEATSPEAALEVAKEDLNYSGWLDYGDATILVAEVVAKFEASKEGITFRKLSK